MRRHLLLALLAVSVSYFASAQTPKIEFVLVVSDGAGGIQELRLGLDPEATDTLDQALGEDELPPPPPFGIFDARLIGLDIGLELGQGTVRDYRAGDSLTIGTTVHELTYQVGTGSGITVSSNLPPTINIRLQDIITGTIIDTTLDGQESYTVTNPGAISKLKLTVTYVLGPLAAPGLISPADGAQGVEGMPTLLWSSVAFADSYHLVVVHDSLISLIVADTTILDTSYTLPLLEPLSDYWWRISSVGVSGEGPFSVDWQFSTMEWLGVEDEMALRKFRLEQNYPNPFNPSTIIRYGLPIRSFVSLTVYNMLGQEVATLFEGEQEAGFHEVQFEAGDLASGVYLYQLQAGDFVQAKKLVVMN